MEDNNSEPAVYVTDRNGVRTKVPYKWRSPDDLPDHDQWVIGRFHTLLVHCRYERKIKAWMTAMGRKVEPEAWMPIYVPESSCEPS